MGVIIPSVHYKVSTIERPVTPDGLAGFDSFGQFWVYWPDYVHEGEQQFTGTIVADLRGKHCILCEKRWEADSAQLRDQHWLNNAGVSVHRSCYLRHLGLIDRQRWYSVVVGLIDEEKFGFEMLAIKNQYGGAWNTPWYTMRFHRRQAKDAPQDTPLEFLPQTMTFGPRKRVDEIRFENLTAEQMAKLEEAFTDVGDTKGRTHDRSNEYHIHAWKDEQVMRYMKTFFTLIGVQYIDMKQIHEKAGVTC